MCVRAFVRVFSKRSSRCQRTPMAASNSRKQTEPVYSLDSAISGEKKKKTKGESRKTGWVSGFQRYTGEKRGTIRAVPKRARCAFSPLAARLKRIGTVQRSRKSCSGERLSQTASFFPLPSFARFKRAAIAVQSRLPATVHPLGASPNVDV